jgi:hypothetical protein
MTCPKCRHENRPGARFCEECAAPLARRCTNCGAELSPTAKFCSDCCAPDQQSALLGHDSTVQPLKTLLVQRTEGTPFFVEESVRTLVETKVLVGDRGGYRLQRPLSTIEVPATVKALLAARIDRLPSEEKAVLQAASVIGTDVPFGLLQARVASRDVAEHALGR